MPSNTRRVAVDEVVYGYPSTSQNGVQPQVYPRHSRELSQDASTSDGCVSQFFTVMPSITQLQLRSLYTHLVNHLVLLLHGIMNVAASASTRNYIVHVTTQNIINTMFIKRNYVRFTSSQEAMSCCILCRSSAQPSRLLIQVRKSTIRIQSHFRSWHPLRPLVTHFSHNVNLILL
jgi:hypothetical protein